MPSIVHILVVEDEPIMAGWMLSVLEPLRTFFPGAVIDVVHSWKDAQAIIFAEPAPTIVLLDLLMPDSNLAQTLSQVPSIEDRCALLIVTGQHRDDVEKGLHGRRVEILEKGPETSNRRSFISAITRALECREKRAEQERFNSVRSIIEELHAKGYGTPTPPTS